MRTTARAGLGLALTGLLVGIGSQAALAVDDTTPVTAEVEGGTLSIAAPATLALAGAEPGSTASGNLGTVTVTDDRADVLGWVTSVSISDFTPDTVTGASIPVSGFTYTPSVATTTGTVAVLESVATGAGPSVVQTASDVTGQNSASWTAAVSLVIPSDALADTYSTTLTHSVI
ncbi:MAG: WxL domain-containing protein [Herbiconiux sp.]|nr:WxL domain-containing protein [Herbiconiux sp.]